MKPIERPIVECVPNFSEGRDRHVIGQIAASVASVEEVQLLHVDSGEAAHRTVITFVGEPQAVSEAAFRAVRTAGQLIDMRQHHGAHPRIGATDVLPLIPVSGITLAECAELARLLAQRIADELHIPCYAYEAAALRPEHRNLANCRRGDYEGLPQRMQDAVEQPDYGARPFDGAMARTGCTVVGARNFLIAVNFNLNTTSTAIANAIAFDVREKGRPLRDGDPASGPVRHDAGGHVVMQPGTLKGTKALGWFIDEYGIAQVSMNITDIGATSLHKAFLEVSRCAERRGVRVTGTEIIGLVPKHVLTDAGRYFLQQLGRPADVSDDELIRQAIDSMGLSELRPYNPKERVIEFLMEE